MANDPKVAVSGNSDRAPETPPKDVQDDAGKDEEEHVPAGTDSGQSTATTTTTANPPRQRTAKRDSSQSLVSRRSGGSSSTSKTTKQRDSIVELRAQAQDAARDGHDGLITIEDGDELARRASPVLALDAAKVSVGMPEPNLGSDDSDGPPSDEEGEEEDEVKGERY